jgi:hypothetical protein
MTCPDPDALGIPASNQTSCNAVRHVCVLLFEQSTSVEYRVVIVCDKGLVLSLNALNEEEAASPPIKRHAHYRKFGAYKSFADADAELRAYWRSRTPQERMEALEELRILNYGQEAIDARIPRVFGVPESRRR